MDWGKIEEAIKEAQNSIKSFEDFEVKDESKRENKEEAVQSLKDLLESCIENIFKADDKGIEEKYENGLKELEQLKKMAELYIKIGQQLSEGKPIKKVKDVLKEVKVSNTYDQTVKYVMSAIENYKKALLKSKT